MNKRNYSATVFLSQFSAASGLKMALAFVLCLLAATVVRAETVYTSTLSGNEAVPANNSPASGVGSVIIDSSESRITVTLKLRDLTSTQFVARIHGSAPRGGVADNIFTLSSGVITQSFNISSSQAADLKAGLWYFNVTTPDFPNGEIRGQIEPLCAPQPVNLKAWYRSENNASDAIGANNGTLPNGAGFESGKVGKAFSFNGINQYAALGNSFTPQTFTISMWVKPSAAQTAFSTIVDNNSTQTANWSILRGSNPDQYSYHDNGAEVFFNLTADEWQNLIIIRANNSVRIYRNGILESFANPNSSVNYDGTQTLMLARAVNSGNQGSNHYWKGQIDEFMIFDRPLADAEIPNLFNSGSAGICTDSTSMPLRKNGKIFFTRRIGATNDQIYSINDVGGNLTNFSNNPNSFYFSPGLSPDGSKIAYARNRVIFIADSNGFNEIPLLSVFIGEQSFPRWSPDGSKIVFSIGGGNQSEIYSVNANGSDLTRITNNSIYDYSAEWSPDGSKIVFTSNFNGNYNIYTMNSDGSGRTRLTDGQNDSAPTWSPDGRKILFSRDSDLHIMNADGSNVVNLVNTPTLLEEESAWSQDGKKIAYVRYVSGVGEQLCVMNADGTNQTVLVSDNLNLSPFWQALPNNQNATISLTVGIDLKFTTVFSSGTAVATQLAEKVLPKLPDGYLAALPTYDIRTSVVFDNALISFKVPSIANAAACEQMRVLHFIDGDWTDAGNSLPSFNSGVCTVSQFVSSFSPFAVARYNFGAQTLSISGTAIYGTTPAGQPSKIVSNVWLTAGGASYVSENTNLNGSYQLDNLIAGEQYVVSAAKTGNANGITPFDATLVLRCVAAGNGCSLTPNQRLAADTNADNMVSPFDATQILRFVAAASQSNASGGVGNWMFTPSSRSYSPLSDSLTDQNFTAILIGEVNGDWLPPHNTSLAGNGNSTLSDSADSSIGGAKEIKRFM